jgi:hypothetical protein
MYVYVFIILIFLFNIKTIHHSQSKKKENHYNWVNLGANPQLVIKKDLKSMNILVIDRKKKQGIYWINNDTLKQT